MKMKIITAAMTAVMVSAAGCAQRPDGNITEGSETGYALDFFRKAVSVSGKGENVVVSPYSAGVALSMLAEGAENTTREELLAALNNVSFSEKPYSDSLADVRSANAVWLKEGFDVRKQYLKTLEDNYGAVARTLDFSDPSTPAVINGWCSDNTEGRIPEIVDNIRPDMVMFLMNALYFKAPWLNAFDKNATAEAPFFGSDGEKQVPFMTRKAKFRYAEYDGSQLVELPYAGGRYSMLLLLPSEKLSADQVISCLDEQGFDAACSQLSEKEVMLKMPRFRIETSMVLNQTLASMGVKKVFSGSAELGMISGSRIAVDEVLQKCFIEVNEEGSEAAAVTSIGVRLTSVRPADPPVYMTVDRPFVFAITDRETGRMLFTGKIESVR